MKKLEVMGLYLHNSQVFLGFGSRFAINDFRALPLTFRRDSFKSKGSLAHISDKKGVFDHLIPVILFLKRTDWRSTPTHYPGPKGSLAHISDKKVVFDHLIPVILFLKRTDWRSTPTHYPGPKGSLVHISDKKGVFDHLIPVILLIEEPQGIRFCHHFCEKAKMPPKPVSWVLTHPLAEANGNVCGAMWLHWECIPNRT